MNLTDAPIRIYFSTQPRCALAVTGDGNDGGWPGLGLDVLVAPGALDIAPHGTLRAERVWDLSNSEPGDCIVVAWVETNNSRVPQPSPDSGITLSFPLRLR